MRVRFALLLAVVLVARAARADLPVTVEVDAVGRASVPPGGLPPNPLGLGLGVRGGVSVFGVYGGLSFVDYFGADVGGGHAVLFGAEAGYGIEPLKQFMLRAQLGVGGFSGTYVPPPVTLPPTTTGSVGQTVAVPPISGSGVYLQPGVLAMFSFGLLTIGTDLSLLLVPSKENLAARSAAPDDTAWTVGLQVGLRF